MGYETLSYTEVMGNVLADMEKIKEQKEKKLTKQELRNIVNQQDKYINKLKKDIEAERIKLTIMYFIICLQMILILL